MHFGPETSVRTEAPRPRAVHSYEMVEGWDLVRQNIFLKQINIVFNELFYNNIFFASIAKILFREILLHVDDIFCSINESYRVSVNFCL